MRGKHSIREGGKARAGTPIAQEGVAVGFLITWAVWDGGRVGQEASRWLGTRKPGTSAKPASFSTNPAPGAAIQPKEGRRSALGSSGGQSCENVEDIAPGFALPNV